MVERISFPLNIELHNIRVIYNYAFILNVRNSFNEIKSDQILVNLLLFTRRWFNQAFLHYANYAYFSFYNNLNSCFYQVESEKMFKAQSLLMN